MIKKILVVDNNPVILQFMTNLLEKKGHQVKTAEDGLSALDILMTYIPDVIFIDLVMPNINGEQLCRIIRKMPELNDTYTVILSATIAERSRDFSAMGADTFIAKASFDQMAKHVLAAIEQSSHNIPDGAPEEITGFKDVYEREITRELISAEGHLETILSNISDAIIELAPEERIIFVNPAAVSLMGLSEEKLLGAKFTELINEDDRKRIEELLMRIDEESEKIDLDTPVLINSRQVSLSAVPVKDDVSASVLIILNDTTEATKAQAILKRDHKELEQLVKEHTDELAIANKKLQKEIHNRISATKILKTSEEKYRSLFEESRDAIVITTGRGEFIDANTTALELFGFKKEEISKMNFGKLYVDPEGVYSFQKEIRKKGSVQNFETRLRGKDDVEMDCIFDVVSRWDEDGSTLVYQGIIRDITDRKIAAAALRESEKQYRSLVDNLPVGVYRNSPGPEGQFFMANPAFCKMFGYSSEEEIKKIAPADLYEHPEERKQYSDSLIENGVVENDELTLKKKDGTPVHTSVTSRVVYGKDGEVSHFDSIMLDITEQKRLENQLQQARKMEAIGNLAGGIAHEFNNALMGIMGNIELLKMDLPEDERRDRYFEAMKGSGHRMSRLTDQLLAYAQGGKYRPRDLRLDGFVIETLQVLQHELNPEVRVETHFEKDISYIKADHTQMQMVLSAILANSNEAMEDEGLIRITAGNRYIDADFTKQRSGLKPGPYVCLTIEDDGKGMDEETKNGIFDPFFTTKFQGRGMGMAAVYGIVKNHEGWIFVDSELGKGTTVQVYLPAISAENKEQGAKAATQPDIELGTGEGTILMIEDEDVVIEVTQTMLERLGYRVMVAKNGKDAIHIAETFDGNIDLALLDIKLPDMDGGRVYPLIMAARPDLKVIVFSGFAIEGPARKILDAGAEDFIQKPFSFAILSKKLKKVLEEGQTS